MTDDNRPPERPSRRMMMAGVIRGGADEPVSLGDRRAAYVERREREAFRAGRRQTFEAFVAGLCLGALAGAVAAAWILAALHAAGP